METENLLDHPQVVRAIWMNTAVMIGVLFLATLLMFFIPVCHQERIWEDGRIQRDFYAIEMAVKGYVQDVGRLPQSLNELVRPGRDKRWKGPYLDEEDPPLDPWSRPYHYAVIGETKFILVSWGGDGKPGGTGENRDRSN